METFEIALLIIAYTTIIITLFLEVICYSKRIEHWESIAFTGSLLLLIIALTAANFTSQITNETDVFTLVTMVLVGLTTPLSVLQERKNNIPDVWKRIVIGLSILLLLLILAGYLASLLGYLQYAVLGFMLISIICSMQVIRQTKPKLGLPNRERTERIFAVTIVVVLPISFVFNHLSISSGATISMGFTYPLMFIVIATSKMWDNIQRLSLVKPENVSEEQVYKNFALTKRETEVARLLIKGQTYVQISEQLYISVPTVKTHTSKIYHKCKVKNRSELIHTLIS
ncbi:response regulator transcription factor [Reichenbachiella sp.]|uniref:response regulator transcription factor n=1 Tax=Reichenbachiella sp. TaxID=2184521 RepID=UPI003BAF8EF6